MGRARLLGALSLPALLLGCGARGDLLLGSDARRGTWGLASGGSASGGADGAPIGQVGGSLATGGSPQKEPSPGGTSCAIGEERVVGSDGQTRCVPNSAIAVVTTGKDAQAIASRNDQIVTIESQSAPPSLEVTIYDPERQASPHGGTIAPEGPLDGPLLVRQNADASTIAIVGHWKASRSSGENPFPAAFVIAIGADGEPTWTTSLETSPDNRWLRDAVVLPNGNVAALLTATLDAGSTQTNLVEWQTGGSGVSERSFDSGDPQPLRIGSDSTGILHLQDSDSTVSFRTGSGHEVAPALYPFDGCGPCLALVATPSGADYLLGMDGSRTFVATYYDLSEEFPFPFPVDVEFVAASSTFSFAHEENLVLVYAAGEEAAILEWDRSGSLLREIRFSTWGAWVTGAALAPNGRVDVLLATESAEHGFRGDTLVSTPPFEAAD